MSYFNGEASHWLTASPAEPLDPFPTAEPRSRISSSSAAD
jgi:hypothetical protein